MAKKPLRIYRHENTHVIDLGTMEIWDGTNMALLREQLTHLARDLRAKSMGVDMTHVKYIPSGFFGMLFDWHELGIHIRLFTPQPNVRGMLWFRRFFFPVAPGVYELRPDMQKATAAQLSESLDSVNELQTSAIAQ